MQVLLMNKKKPINVFLTIGCFQQDRRKLSSTIMFNYLDPLNIDSLLTNEERQAKDLANKYCQQELQPSIVKSNRNETFDKKIFTTMGELGKI